ncbi:MAG: IS110 family transposase [Actinomycetota bacterium]
MMAEPGAGVIGGVDTHAEVHVAAALCAATQQLLGVESFPATERGYEQLLAWLQAFGTVERVGVEGTGSYGAGLARLLAREGVAAVEVDRADRKARRHRGKSDAVDAEAAARAVAAGTATATPKARDGLAEATRLHLLAYDAAVAERTATLNRLHAVATTAPAGIRQEAGDVANPARLAAISRWRRRAGDDVVAAACRQVLSGLARHVAHLTTAVEQARSHLDQLTAAAAPGLRDMHGVGPITAAQLLTTVGDNPDRIRSEAALARLCGVAPLPLSVNIA